MVNEFRISGGVGIEPDPVAPNQQVLLQGIGFPLRPIDNVPPTDADEIPDDLVAEGLFMQWMGLWTQGRFYPKGSYVQAGFFTAIANKITLENPEPQPTAAPAYIMPDPWINGSTEDTLSVVECIQNITFNTEGWVKGLRVWVPAIGINIEYEIVVGITIPGQTRIARRIVPTVLTPGAWTVVTLLNDIIPAGTLLELFLASLNSSATTDIDGGWTFQGNTQGIAPQFESWTVNNQQSDFRIDKTDLDGTDRSTELESVLPDSIITVVQTNDVALNTVYRVNGVLDQGTYMQYAVILQSQAGGGPKAGEATSIEIDVPVPLATQYEAEAGFYPAGNPSWGTVETELRFNDVDQAAPATTAYGIDIEFEPASVSDDWDLVTVP